MEPLDKSKDIRVKGTVEKADSIIDIENGSLVFSEDSSDNTVQSELNVDNIINNIKFRPYIGNDSNLKDRVRITLNTYDYTTGSRARVAYTNVITLLDENSFRSNSGVIKSELQSFYDLSSTSDLHLFRPFTGTNNGNTYIRAYLDYSHNKIDFFSSIFKTISNKITIEEHDKLRHTTDTITLKHNEKYNINNDNKMNINFVHNINNYSTGDLVGGNEFLRGASLSKYLGYHYVEFKPSSSLVNGVYVPNFYIGTYSSDNTPIFKNYFTTHNTSGETMSLEPALKERKSYNDGIVFTRENIADKDIYINIAYTTDYSSISSNGVNLSMDSNSNNYKETGYIKIPKLEGTDSISINYGGLTIRRASNGNSEEINIFGDRKTFDYKVRYLANRKYTVSKTYDKYRTVARTPEDDTAVGSNYFSAYYNVPEYYDFYTTTLDGIYFKIKDVILV